MAGPSRFGAIVVVSVLSLLVLGAVWGLVIYLLPQNEGDPERPRIIITPASEAPIEPPPQFDKPELRQPDRTVPPVIVRESPAPPTPSHPSSEPARVPLGLDLKCDAEVEALCPESEGIDRRTCMQGKVRQLSPPCQQVIRERMVRMKENFQHLRAACEADAKQFCREVPLGGGAMVQCLEEHAQEVSDQCFQLLPKRGRLLN